jgi:hypothetical protein
MGVKITDNESISVKTLTDCSFGIKLSGNMRMARSCRMMEGIRLVNVFEGMLDEFNSYFIKALPYLKFEI